MNRNHRALPLLAAILIANSQATSAQPVETYANASAVFRKAMAGDVAATGQAVRAFEILVAADSPETPLYLSYLGAAQSLEGRNAWMPWAKIKATERGLDTLDKALRSLQPPQDTIRVNDVPVSMEVRFVVAQTFLTVPDSIFHRADQGRKLLQDVLKHPLFVDSPAEFRNRVETVAASRVTKP